MKLGVLSIVLTLRNHKQNSQYLRGVWPDAEYVQVDLKQKTKLEKTDQTIEWSKNCKNKLVEGDSQWADRQKNGKTHAHTDLRQINRNKKKGTFVSSEEISIRSCKRWSETHSVYCHTFLCSIRRKVIEEIIRFFEGKSKWKSY